MCIISNAPKGTVKDSEYFYNCIRKGYSCNRQGSGYMYKRNGETNITIKKGFFDVEKLIDSLRLEDLKVDDELSVHHRISTGGKTDTLNTHPFVISKIHKEVVATDININKPCLTHNGVFRDINGFERLNSDFSDTYAFSRYIMTLPEVMNLFKNDLSQFEKTLKEILGWSKITILFPDMDMKMYGSFVEDKGYFHSNRGYEDITTYDRGGSSFFSNVHHTPIVNSPNRNQVKTDITKLDNSSIFINSKNAKHFYFVKKTIYDNLIPTVKPKFFYCDDYDDECETNVISAKGRDEIIVNYALNNKRIQKEYYFIPKNQEILNIYREYLILLTTPGDIGKQTIKKLDNLVQRNINKIDETKLWYKKLSRFFTKSALALYLDFLKSSQLVQKNTNSQEIRELTFSD